MSAFQVESWHHTRMRMVSVVFHKAVGSIAKSKMYTNLRKDMTLGKAKA